MCDLCVPKGMAPNIFLRVKGFCLNLSVYLTPVKLEILQKTGFQVDELILHLGIGVSSHVLGNNELLDLLEFCLDIL
jgi:hypothetical protein